MSKTSKSQPAVFDQRGQHVGQQINIAGDGHITLPPPPAHVPQVSPPASPSAATPAHPKPPARGRRKFDVFLSHNSQDKPTVRQLADELERRALNSLLDERELIPGLPWQEALEEIVRTTKSAAVLVAKDGIGPWQDCEMRACLSEFVNRGLPVIPVLLPGAPKKPSLPIFLKQFNWVDLRAGFTPEGLDRLVWGINGKKPSPKPLLQP